MSSGPGTPGTTRSARRRRAHILTQCRNYTHRCFNVNVSRPCSQLKPFLRGPFVFVHVEAPAVGIRSPAICAADWACLPGCSWRRSAGPTLAATVARSGSAPSGPRHHQRLRRPTAPRGARAGWPRTAHLEAVQARHARASCARGASWQARALPTRARRLRARPRVISGATPLLSSHTAQTADASGVHSARRQTQARLRLSSVTFGVRPTRARPTAAMSGARHATSVQRRALF